MYAILLPRTVSFPMNVLLPLLVVGALIMALRELLPTRRLWQLFWMYSFMAVVFILIGWPPKFMQDAVIPAEATAAALP